MREFLKRIRDDRIQVPFGRLILFSAAFLLCGAAAGILAKVSDVYSEILGNFTSGMCLWIFLGVLICAFSKSPFRAVAYVFLFCVGMIAAYYLTAVIADWYYSVRFVKGWCVFTLLTPVFALLAWHARGRGAAAWVLRIGIVLVMAVSLFLFPGNVLLDALCIAAAFAVTVIKIKEKDNDGA